MIRYFMWLIAIFFGIQMLGCSTIVKGDGEWGFKQSTTWAFYSLARSSADEASISYEFQALEDWIKSQTKEE